MERMEKSVKVNCPVDTVYNQWTQFEDLPKFMAGVKEVKQLDDTHVRVDVWGKEREWDSEIVEQVPDRRIAWRSVSGDAPNAGEVRFEPLAEDSTFACHTGDPRSATSCLLTKVLVMRVALFCILVPLGAQAESGLYAGGSVGSVTIQAWPTSWT